MMVLVQEGYCGDCLVVHKTRVVTTWNGLRVSSDDCRHCDEHGQFEVPPERVIALLSERAKKLEQRFRRARRDLQKIAAMMEVL